MHTHTYTHVYTCTRINLHIHMHIQLIRMSVHIHTYTYIHTRMKHVHMHARKHFWNDGTAVTVREADADAGSFTRLFRSTQLRRKCIEEGQGEKASRRTCK